MNPGRGEVNGEWKTWRLDKRGCLYLQALCMKEIRKTKGEIKLIK